MLTLLTMLLRWRRVVADDAVVLCSANQSARSLAPYSVASAIRWAIIASKDTHRYARLCTNAHNVILVMFSFAGDRC